jgi:hypothetical protein
LRTLTVKSGKRRAERQARIEGKFALSIKVIMRSGASLRINDDSRRIRVMALLVLPTAERDAGHWRSTVRAVSAAGNA